MIGYILLLWILINMSPPAWTYVLLGFGVLIKTLKCGIDLAKASE